MSEQYPGGFITKTPPTPAGPYLNSTAQGMWTLSQAAGYQKQNLWPIPGNVAPPGTYSTPLLDGTVILNGWGLMIYKTGFSTALNAPGTSTTASFVVPSNCTKIRVVCIGGGGGASDNPGNIVAGQGGGGMEAFITVTPGETLTVGVGLGGQGRYTGSSGLGAGGDSYIRRSGSDLVRAYGGASTYYTTDTQNTRVSGTLTTGTLISSAYGGMGGNYGGTVPNAAGITLNLSGALYHGGGSGSSSTDGAYGLGFGGGGGRQATTNPADRNSGGTYGYQSGVGSSGGGYKGLGPVGGWANDSNADLPGSSFNSGGGGGSFGGGGADYYSGGYGAGGLVRIWWASNAGDAAWINTGANYGS